MVTLLYEVWIFQTLLYKPMENAKNQKFELFFLLWPKFVLMSLKLTIIAFEQELVSIWGHYRHNLACETYNIAMYAIAIHHRG